MTMATTVNILTCIFEATIIMMFINTYIEIKESIPLYRYLGYVFLLSCMIYISNVVVSLGLLNLICVMISIFIIAYIYNKHIKMNIILSIISVLILTISEMIVLYLITILMDVTIEQVDVIDDYRILGTIISKLFAFFVLKFFCVRHKKSMVLTMKTSYWLLFLIMFVTSVITIFLIFKLQYESYSVIMHNLSVWCSFGNLYSTFFALYLYENIAKQAEIEKEQEIYKRQIKAQAKHLDEILFAQKQIKKLRHDLTNHNISIQSFFENQDYKSGIKYMKNMNALTDISENNIETGNTALDAIINTKKDIAVSKGIEFLCNVQIPENIFVEAIDLCMIFGNALDNAIEACEKVKEDKRIMISIMYDEASLICKIINSAVKSNKRFLQTIKKDKDNHGFGIENIKSALSKYKNICRFTQTDKEFILSFVIFEN